AHPTGAVSETEFHPKQAFGYAHRVLRQLSHVTRPGRRYRLAIAHQIAFPGSDHIPRLLGLEPGIALPQDLLEPLPVINESRFHVEHAPIQKSSTTAG